MMTWRECWEEFKGLLKCAVGSHDWQRRAGSRVGFCKRPHCDAKRIWPL